MAYYNIQGTRPAQLSASLIDSPVGLLSWIGHFFVAMGSSPTMTLDSVLKDVSLYWFTGCIGTSFLVYGTNPLLSELHKDPKNFIKVPFGYSGFPKELTGEFIRGQNGHNRRACDSRKQKENSFPLISSPLQESSPPIGFKTLET